MALATELGLEVSFTGLGLDAFVQRLYAARRRAQDIELARLQFHRVPSRAELLWIVKGPKLDSGVPADGP